jgi:hypothetical protein
LQVSAGQKGGEQLMATKKKAAVKKPAKKTAKKK